MAATYVRPKQRDMLAFEFAPPSAFPAVRSAAGMTVGVGTEAPTSFKSDMESPPAVLRLDCDDPVSCEAIFLSSCD